jgi:hypothetical protein
MNWISIKERFPQDEHCVLIFIEFKGYFVAYIKDGMWHVMHPDGITMRFNDNKLTHWMELPEPPYNKDIK